MENKYFVPDISEMHVSCEFEMHDTWGGWKKLVLTEELLKYPMVGLGSGNERAPWYWNFRVPYLTKEQIISEGWSEFITEYRGDIKKENMNYVFFKEESNYMLGWFFNTNIISLLVKDPAKALDINGNIIEYHNTPKYTGECKDINTFRLICKLLKI